MIDVELPFFSNFRLIFLNHRLIMDEWQGCTQIA